ncbi:unnamed protein product [Cuscuta campestris]|uniref:Uncharacterized protein n=1 Tax=Cuscuta campestris TaxID=132261 RepID=A0A484M268_9ASTE|nr:unnamed protein product [Cuscuta campestris]
MIVSDSESTTPSSNSRQADQSASGRNPGHTQSPHLSPSAASGHKRCRLRKQFPSSTPVDEGSRVGLDENIMALCHCQITDRGFADATDMVGPSIEVLRPTSTQTALDAPTGFFTVHLVSLKKGLRFPLHPLLIEFLNVVDLLPCQLVPNSHRYIAGYLVRCKSPPHSVMPGGDLTGCSQGVASERPPSPPAVTYEVATGGRSTRICIPPLPQSLGDVQLETLITLPAEDQARISAGSEDDLDNMVLLRLSQTSEARQKDLPEEVARLTRELEEKENRCAALAVERTSQENRCVALEADKASLSSEVESVSARVVELEREKSDLIQQLEVERSDRVHHGEETVEYFKSSPDFTMVAMERMDELTAAWLKTEPGAQWMVREGTKSFNCGLFRAQQVFRDKLAQLPKGFSLPDLGFPPPCRSLAEFDPSPYLDGGSSSASEEEEEEEVEGGQGDQNPGVSLAMSKAGGHSGSAV